MQPEQHLLLAIVAQAVHDATASNPLVLDDYRAKGEADSWIRSCGRDMRMICESAGVDPYALRDRYVAGELTTPKAHRQTRRKARTRDSDAPWW